MADVLAGVSIVLFYSSSYENSNFYYKSILLLTSTAGLYAGGIVFNDVFDAGLDRVERPERMIPSGIITEKAAKRYGCILFIIALISSALVSITSFVVACTIVVLALLYDSKSKHHSLAGPLNMGLCRGCNLLLGISLMPAVLKQNFYLAIVPVIYIFAVTTISRDEVHGGKRKNLATAFILYLLVFFILYMVCRHTGVYAGLWIVLPFCIAVMTPLYNAWQAPYAKNIVKAVKAGVLSIIFLDAAWAAIHQQVLLCGLILCFLPFSILLGKYFAIT